MKEKAQIQRFREVIWERWMLSPSLIDFSQTKHSLPFLRTKGHLESWNYRSTTTTKEHTGRSIGLEPRRSSTGNNREREREQLKSAWNTNHRSSSIQQREWHCFLIIATSSISLPNTLGSRDNVNQKQKNTNKLIIIKDLLAGIQYE
jgi:hypothetical protein